MSEGYAVKVRPEKAAAVEKIRAELEASQAAVITEYRGLTVQQLAELRTQAARDGVELHGQQEHARRGAR